MTPWIRWLDEINEDDLSRVGGKALNLARLCRAGFDVPKGFVLSANFHAPSLQGSADPGGLPAEIREAVVSRYGQLGCSSVAVRSSAIGEDSSEASFAGQGRSVLNVRTEEELLRAIAEVCRSMDEAAARSYARQMGIATRSLAVHVVVQEMIDAESAGVLFTANPVSGREDEVVINATWGLGEPLVSGKVTPDELVVDKATGKLKRSNTGSKELTMTFQGLRPTPPAKAAAPCLRDEQIRQLVEAAHQVEDRFGRRQDVEWAWDGRLRILQTRPLTTRAGACGGGPAPGPGGEAERLWEEEIRCLRSAPGARSKVWAASGMAELLPCPTPLSWKVAARLMSGGEGYGLAQRRLGFDPAPETILDRIAGHIYVDLDRENSLFFQHAPIGYAPGEIHENLLRAHLPKTGVQWRKLRPGLLVRWPALIFQLARSLVRQRRMSREFPAFFDREWLPAFTRSVEEVRRRDLTGLEPQHLLAEFEARLGHFLNQSAPVLMMGSILSAMNYRALEDLLISRLGQDGIELAQKLMSGLKPNPTLEMHEAMGRVAQGDESEACFLRRFGHRCGGDEFELAVPRWREDAASLRAQIQQLREMGRLREGATAQGRMVREEADARLQGLSKGWGRVAREMVQARLNAARRLFPLRERSKDYLLMEFETLRHPLVLLDQQLRLAGGIFYLGLDEVREAIARVDVVRERIEKRRRQHELCRLLSPPQIILGSQLVKPDRSGIAPAAGSLAGVGVSPGVAQGPVRVLKSADDLADVQKGDILVVPSLEPTWTCAFTQAGGLVAERGAVLSHGAIVAREFAVPAVVNVPEATVRLRDGQIIMVNGMTGRIEEIQPRTEATTPGPWTRQRSPS